MEGNALREALVREASDAGKPAWRPMLCFLADLHGRSVHPPVAHFPYPFEEIGPGYRVQGMGFGHFDLTHAALDNVRAAPEHVRNQIRNQLAGQQADGLIPGVVYLVEGKAHWKDFKSFPQVWPVAVDAYVEATSDTAFLAECLDSLQRQIVWYENKRAAPGGGFFYLDTVQDTWESGVDEGVRYDERPVVPGACVDACSHLYLAYESAARWSRTLGRPDTPWADKAKSLQRFIREELFDPQSGFFYDAWTARRPELRRLAFEGMWPVVAGAATQDQAVRVLDEHLLNPKEFCAPHPISTVALCDPKFELRMWRGPTWNCMTLWAARGAARYGRADAARRLLEAALDATALQFERTGTLWEFYHPRLGAPSALLRKPQRGQMSPCRDYIGHNPLFAMADLWRKCFASR